MTRVNWDFWPDETIEAFVNRQVSLNDLRFLFKRFGESNALKGVYQLERRGVKSARSAARKALRRKRLVGTR